MPNTIFDFLNSNRIKSQLNNRQIQIVLGCLLGQAYIISPKNKAKYFYLQHNKNKDINILAFKGMELQNLGRHTALIEDKNSYKWYSMSHTEWNKVYNLCYKNNKKHLTMEWLDRLSYTSWAIMLLDLGKLKKNTLILTTSKFKEQNKILEQYFNELDYYCHIKNDNIHFENKSAIRFLQAIQQEVPECLLYIIQRYIP